MESSNRKATKENKHPRVPIKTYKWEDVRRSRRRGGYPWTHLYKLPLGDEMDKTETTASREPSEWEELMLEEAQDISEVRELSTTPTHLKTSSSSLGAGGSYLEDKRNRAGIFFLDSAESSDDISQYLDKEEQTVVARTEFGREESPEDAQTRKRKVSEGSDNSRISLGKALMVKKLRDAKAKIKVPKLSIPTGRFRKTTSKKSSSPPKSQTTAQVKKDTKGSPVYIHIPLKPPPGEQDSSLESKTKTQPKKLRSFKDAVKGMKHLHGDQKEIGTISEETTENNPKNEQDVVGIENKDEVQQGNEVSAQQENDKTSEENVINDPPRLEGESGVTEKDDEQNNAQYNEMFDELFKASSSATKTETKPRDRTLRSKSAEPERKRKLSLESAYSRKSLSKLGLLKKLKNASEKIKKAFSRPNLKQEKDEAVEVKQQKPKEKKKNGAESLAPVYIHIPLKGENAEEVEEPEVEETDAEEQESQSAPGKVELIILTAPSDDEVLDYNSSDVPETPSSENKLFFGGKISELKELAKGAIDGVTPEEKQKLCTVREEASENGASAKSDQPDLTPPDEAELVADSSGNIETSEPDDETGVMEPKQLSKLNLVDEEDGLKETKLPEHVEEHVKTFDTEQTQEVKEQAPQLEMDSLVAPTEEFLVHDEKTESQKCELSPKLKKKVSFKKKAKLLGNGSYEDVEVPQDSFEEKEAVSISDVKNENESLDVEAVKLPEEEDNKWSKISDHEYEPVNPPTEEFVMIPCSTTSPTSMVFNLAMDNDRPSPDLLDPTPSTPEPSIDDPVPEKKSNLHKIHSEFKRKAQDLKGRFHAMKKPHISLPARPVFNKPSFKMEKAKMSLQRVRNKLPSLKPSVTRHHSTESNDGDAKKSIFSTYPRIFRKKSAGSDAEREAADFATVPRNRTKKSSGGEPIRIPLHSEESVESDSPEELVPPSRFSYVNDDECNVENDFDRWDHGNFFSERPVRVVTDLDMPEEQPIVQEEYKEQYSSGSSNGLHRQGVLEEIDSDEFFLRQKGISQDNIEVGMYLSSEIRDAFRTPTNALSQMHHPQGSTHSIPEVSSMRKPMKKPKRKKTPHVSQERIEPYDESGEDELDLPPRPKRNSRRSRKQKPPQEDLIPYQETISVEEPHGRLFEHRESLAVLGDDERDEEMNAFENDEGVEVDAMGYVEEPVVPPRKQKSLKSLSLSENDSILGRAYSDDVIPKLGSIRTESKLIIPIPSEVPRRPSRSRSRSQINSKNFEDNKTNGDEAGYIPYADDLELDHHQKHPEVTTVEDLVVPLVECEAAYVNEIQQEPCVEEICKQDIRDCMGYAIIDKSKARDPPLPPPRIPKRRKKLHNKFATIQGAPHKEKSPIRPLRNYSTLNQIKKTRPYTKTIEEKENIDITQYIEIDDATKKLQSGDVIQKMKDRPLPAPPRPPRKTRPLHDMASEENVMVMLGEEAEVSTQTEPLPDDFVCEEVVLEPTDTVIIPTERLKGHDGEEPPENRALGLDSFMGEKIVEEPLMVRHKRQAGGATKDPVEAEQEINLITPTFYTYEETVTHGSLLVEPLDGAEILPQQKEKIIPVHVEESNDEETSSIPEEFNKLSAPSEAQTAEEDDVLRKQPIQLRNLDIDTLTVTRLLADKIIVSELDAGTIKTNEIASETLTGVNQPSDLLKEMVEAIKIEQAKEEETTKVTSSGDLIISAEREIENASVGEQFSAIESTAEPLPEAADTTQSSKNQPMEAPTTPPRPSRQSERKKSTPPREEPEVDDEPPPRPPQPQIPYIPSQPPASFYALKAERYVEGTSDSVPLAPRRRRHAKAKHRSRTSSDESSETTVPRRRSHRRSSSPTLGELSSTLLKVCGGEVNGALKRVVAYVLSNVHRSDDEQDVGVVVVIVLVLIAGLILLGYGQEKTVVHLHHWDYFNPPTNM